MRHVNIEIENEEGRGEKGSLHSSHFASMAPVVNKVYPGFLCGCDPTEDCVGAPGGIEVCVG